MTEIREVSPEHRAHINNVRSQDRIRQAISTERKRRTARALRARSEKAYDGTMLTHEQVAQNLRDLRTQYYQRRDMKAPTP